MNHTPPSLSLTRAAARAASVARRPIASPAAPAPVSLHIDRVVLDGIALGIAGRGVMQTALETELSDLLNTRGLSAQLLAGTAQPSLQAGDIALAPGKQQPRELGQAIAQALHTRLGS